MCRRNPALETAINVCEEAGVVYRFERTANKHIMFYVGIKGKVLIGDKCNDPRWVKNVRSNVLQALKQELIA